MSDINLKAIANKLASQDGNVYTVISKIEQSMKWEDASLSAIAVAHFKSIMIKTSALFLV